MKLRNFAIVSIALIALTACNKKAADTASTEQPTKLEQLAPPPGGTWTDVVNRTGAGGYMMGNPDAKVKLIEIGALTCPHCREFDEKGVPTLVDQYVKSGQVSWEFRPYMLHGLDLPAALVATCNGPKTFFPLARALYKDQEVWVGKIQKVPEAQLTQVQNLPPSTQFVELAKLVGLQDWAAARGVPQAKSNQCLRDEDKINQLVQMSADVTNDHPDFRGTPSFLINGKLLDDTASWDKLEPQLKDALK